VLARARNLVPEASLLPLPSLPTNGSSYLIHHRFYSEADGFQHPYYDEIEVKPATQPTQYIAKRRRLHALSVIVPHTALTAEVISDTTIRYDRISLQWQSECVVIQYHHTSGLASTSTLEPDQWVRLRYNRRYAVDAGWVYDKWVFNIQYLRQTSMVE
jgi:hypothetical protein